MTKLTVKTIKEYSATYYEGCFNNGAQFNESDEKIMKSVASSLSLGAHDKFVIDTNRYSSIPTPNYSECKFDVSDIRLISDNNGFRHYAGYVTVTWQYNKK